MTDPAFGDVSRHASHEVHDQYGDIIDVHYEGPKRHTRMPVRQRAAQFMPFAALRGYEERLERVRHEVEEDVESSHR